MAFDFLDKWLSLAVDKVPLLWWVLGVAALAMLALKLARAEEGAAFSVGEAKLLPWKDSTLAQKLKGSINDLDRVNKKQAQVILLSRTLANDIAYLFSLEDIEETEIGIQKSIDMIVAGLPAIMSADGSHRCAVLIPEDEDEKALVVHTAHGYRRESEDKMRLAIPDSVAGYAYHSRKTYYCRDLTKDHHWKPLPNQRVKYHSIMCTPIVSGDECLGVLNIDAVEADAFSDDDIAYLELFAYQLVTLLTLEEKVLSFQEGGSHDEAGGGEGEPR